LLKSKEKISPFINPKSDQLRERNCSPITGVKNEFITMELVHITINNNNSHNNAM
jgi:hypothetical protein